MAIHRLLEADQNKAKFLPGGSSRAVSPQTYDSKIVPSVDVTLTYDLSASPESGVGFGVFGGKIESPGDFWCGWDWYDCVRGGGS